MKATELITALATVVAHHGDLDVVFYNTDHDVELRLDESEVEPVTSTEDDGGNKKATIYVEDLTEDRREVAKMARPRTVVDVDALSRAASGRRTKEDKTIS